jgi:hypothetical protein
LVAEEAEEDCFVVGEREEDYLVVGEVGVEEAVEGYWGLGGRILAFLFEKEIRDGENDDGSCD